MPTLDPSDFSEVQPGRIVLARPGILGFASMIRSAEQINWLNPKTPVTYESPSTFLATNFGDMKVIPELPYGQINKRPEHWWKYRTPEETVAGFNTRTPQLSPTRTLSGEPPPAIARPQQDETIAKLLRDREAVRAAAKAPEKRIFDVKLEHPVPAKRAHRIRNLSQPEITESFVRHIDDLAQNRIQSPKQVLTSSPTSFGSDPFVGRNSALLAAPPNDVDQSFTVTDDDETLTEDWTAVEAMLKQMPDEEKAEPSMHFMGFNLDALNASRFHGDDETTEADDDNFAEKQYEAGNHGGEGGKGEAENPRIASLLAASMTQSFPPTQQHVSRGSFAPRVSSHLGQSSFDPEAVVQHPQPTELSGDTTPSGHGMLGGGDNGNTTPKTDFQQRPRTFDIFPPDVKRRLGITITSP